MSTTDTPTGSAEEAAQEKVDPTAKFNYGMNSFELSHWVQKLKQPFEAEAYIEGTGVVLITNQNTINDEPKIKKGNAKSALPDKLIFLTLETLKHLNPSRETYVCLRKPPQEKLAIYARSETRTRVEEVLRAKKE